MSGGSQRPRGELRSAGLAPAEQPDRPADRAPKISAELAGPPRTESEAPVAAHRPGEYVVMAALTLLLYLAVSGWILLASHGVPYVIDNNESFSTLWHAANLVHFGLGSSFGLADEVFSPRPAAHPYVHTHQGDVPRLYAALLYLLGAQTIQAQIVVTTATAGLVSVGLLYHVLARVASPRFGLLAASVFLSDYLFFVQWQVNTYRVWHTLLLFAALTCVLGLGDARRRRRWLALTMLTYLCLFYYELVFAAFVSIFAGLFCLARYWRRPRVLIMAYAVQAAGALVALGVLGVQLVGFLGWDGLRDDLYLTYVARNLADAPAGQAPAASSMHAYLAFIGRLSATDPTLQASLKRYYDQHNAIFWWNLVDSRPLRSIRYFVGSLFVWVFQISTPLLTLLVVLPLGGAGLGWLLEPGRSLARGGRFARRATVGQRAFGLRLALDVRLRPAEAPADGGQATWPRIGRVGRAVAVAAIALLPFASLLGFFLLTLLRDRAYLGEPLSRLSFLRQVGLLGAVELGLAALGGSGLVAWAAADRCRPWRVSVWRFWLAAGLLGVTSFAIRAQSRLYDQGYAPIWLDRLEAAVPLPISRLAVASCVLLAVLLTLAGPRRLLGPAATVVGRVMPLLACGGIAYALVYYLAAGYVLSGYLVRFSPMPVYVVDVGIALAAWIVLGATLRGIETLVRPARAGEPSPAARPSWWPRRLAAGLRALAVAPAGVFLIVYWLQVQRAYLDMLPPGQFTPVFELLAEPPYRGSSVVANMYAAAMAWQVQEWGYFDPVLGLDRVEIADGLVRVDRDLDNYVWLADKRTNPAYLTPAYYICMFPRSLRTVLDEATSPPDRLPRCGDVPLVARAAAAASSSVGLPPRPRLVARDPSERDAWAILALDWQLGPGLRLADPRQPVGASP